MALLVRSWNLFHGNASPPRREGYLEEMVRLASADRPDLLLLQEVPAWALGRLGEWSGMTAVADVAQPPRLGPVPIPAELGHRLTRLHHGRLRSAFAGQANAILVVPELRVAERHVLALNPARFRSPKARALGLDTVARLAWAKERRICQAVRLRLPGRGTAVAANVHATSFPGDPRIPDAELLRAAAFVDALADPSELVVFGGDVNITPGQSTTLGALTGPERGFSAPGPGLNHLLVRGAQPTPLETWPEERRRHDGVLLSDHPPVELRIP